ncbi:MAG: acyltransferase family protein, partial [Acidimicrobiales bacterium]
MANYLAVAKETSPPSAAPEAGSAQTARHAHLWSVDIVRLGAFTAVIMVHSIAFTERPGNVAAAAAMMLLQFGREVFFALTAFVLMYSYLNKPVDARMFWRKRFPLVVVPYLVWSAIYIVITPIVWGTPTFGWDQLVGDVFYGLAKYHLYFMLVTMQIYMLFPLIAR